ncbi:hypothetical protein BZA77DRAFT_356810 [Pyronema omphalodes]|nr:hypothetical protein BZA77DRAFT_356810 [Pyronema omphalodes]
MAATTGRMRPVKVDEARAQKLPIYPPSQCQLEQYTTQSSPTRFHNKKQGEKSKVSQKFTEGYEQRLFKILLEVVKGVYDSRSDDATRINGDAKFLKAYYSILMKQRKPSGDPDHPENVTAALDVVHMIKEKLHVSTTYDNQTVRSRDAILQGADEGHDINGGLSDAIR